MCISPLTSLMMDQRSKFTPWGLTAEFVGEAQTDHAAESVLVFITPESLISNVQYRNMLLSTKYKEI